MWKSPVLELLSCNITQHYTLDYSTTTLLLTTASVKLSQWETNSFSLQSAHEKTVKANIKIDRWRYPWQEEKNDPNPTYYLFQVFGRLFFWEFMILILSIKFAKTVARGFDLLTKTKNMIISPFILIKIFIVYYRACMTYL